MPEIPEHLLKRSKAAKAAKTGGDATEGSATPDSKPTSSEVTPAAAAQQPVPAGPPVEFPNLDPEPTPTKPEPSYITASKERKRPPIWATLMVAALPFWAYSFAGTMQQPETEDIVAIEGEIFYSGAGCAGCHGGGGGGGTGYPLSGGEVLQTFPEPIDMMVHIARGSAEINGQEYGAPRTDGSRRVAGSLGNMPAQLGSISLLQLELIVYHERVVLSGEDASSPEYEAWNERLAEEWEAGGEGTPLTEEDLELLLACANPDVTPGATGAGAPDDAECPGPGSAEDSEE